MNKIELWMPSPAMLRLVAEQLEKEAELADVEARFKMRDDETLVKAARAALFEPREVLRHTIPGLPVDGEDSETPDPEILPPKPTGARPRGRPKKTVEPVIRNDTEQAKSLGFQSNVEMIVSTPVTPVVTMPNGVVLNAPSLVASGTVDITALPPAHSTPTITLAGAVADYANAFKIAGLSALAKREGVAKFTELSEARQADIAQEMMQAVALGVPAA
jgi:hypothetical protein